MPDFVTYPHAALTIRARPRRVDDAMVAAGARVPGAAREAQAYGLAAAHLGLDEPLVVVSIAADPSVRDYRVLFNPEVISAAEETETGPEGSVSLPGIEVPVERPVRVEIAYDDAAGRRETMHLAGFAARVVQHEIEQMNGIFFLSRVSRLKRETALRKFEKSRRQHG